MSVSVPGVAVLAVALASSVPAAAHHSNPLYFDMSNPITLEGKVMRVEWINPHILLYLESQNDKGELETWVLQGSSPSNAVRRPGLKERVHPGIRIAARVFPPRNPLYVNDVQTVLLTKPDDPRKSARIVGAGQIRLPSGEILNFGSGAPTF